MNISRPFIKRPVATTLLTLGIALVGLVAFKLLPVAALPQVDFPTIAVSAYLPGASPETMAATVATPLERSLGRIAGVTEMTSTSSLGSTRIILQFDLNRDIDGAARDVQAAINGARSLLPSGMPTNPWYRKVNPADAPVMILALTSQTMTRGQLYDAASTILAQKLSQVEGVGQVYVGGSSLPAVRVELNPALLNRMVSARSRSDWPLPLPTPTGLKDRWKPEISTGRFTPTIRPKKHGIIFLWLYLIKTAPPFACPTWETSSIPFRMSATPDSSTSNLPSC